MRNRFVGFLLEFFNKNYFSNIETFSSPLLSILQILTVKAGEEDYLDTSYLLRQASPYMKIK